MAKFVKTEIQIMPHIKAGLKYKVLDLSEIKTDRFQSLVQSVPEIFFVISTTNDDSGIELLCKYKGCAHLFGSNWEVIEENDNE